VYPEPLQDLIDELGRLPGIGPKNAARLAFHLLRANRDDAEHLATAIAEMKRRTTYCPVCCSVSADDATCAICLDDKRDTTLICVVQDPRDLTVVEKSGSFSGRYHVLHGAMNPLEGIGESDLRIRELLIRVDGGGVSEVILCLNPTVEGDVAGMHLSRLLAPRGVTVTKIASGVPVGGDLEYADELTLGRAIEGRRSLDA